MDGMSDGSKPKLQIDDGNGVLKIRFPIGQNVFVTVGRFNGKAVLSVRQFYQAHPEQEDVWGAYSVPRRVLPGKKGIDLNPQQWQTIETVAGKVEVALQVVIEDKSFLKSDLQTKISSD
ncbi:activated RNA polymerase II transcriptional coactivator p15-like [Branchiostoma lanceolatum]|uniref:activated RNA polymerase II transcriptional coactivator p15-like n=1 Tax=Branchiostoma lanceolatum TaxID=7740 RepID=UPI003455DE68